ncbi:hypothetical protein HPB48_006564 [Haemaphysalis longicornis]|uniref:Uncharacterized protein n=1 Tax=Haemaphysalis longicornis TaxID=44386 RepID=A0A9J6GPE7_HAELO|nr:hypothetical protein HPB48_006564 [Haemaphysalis longicornis]
MMQETEPVYSRAFVCAVSSCLVTVAATPILLFRDQSSSCVYVVLVTSAWALLGSVPSPITWFALPCLLLPLTGLATTPDIAVYFIQDSWVLLLLGASMLSSACEDAKLYSRAALALLSLFGCRMRSLLVGLTLVTFAVSQVLPPGVTTLLMASVVEAVMFELENDLISASLARGLQRHRRVRTVLDDDLFQTAVSVRLMSAENAPPTPPQQQVGFVQPPGAPDEDEVSSPEEEEDSEVVPDGSVQNLPGLVPLVVSSPRSDAGIPRHRPSVFKAPTTKSAALEPSRLLHIKRALLLCVAYASTVGGISNIFENTARGILVRFFRDHFRWEESNNANWLAVALPVSVAATVFCACVSYFGYLNLYDLIDETRHKEAIRTLIRKKKRVLGQVTLKEVTLLTAIIVILTLWYVVKSGDHRDEQHMKGAVQAAALFLIIGLLSAIPGGRASGFVFSRKSMPLRLPWSVAFTIGGGLSITAAMETSGLSSRLAEQLLWFDFLTPLQTQVILATASTLLTELHAHTAIVNFLVPIVTHLALHTGVHPLYYALPVTMAACVSTVMPSSAMAIAIVYSVADVEVPDILFSGLVVKFVLLVIITVCVNFIGDDIFKWDSRPPWTYDFRNDSRFGSDVSHV